MFEMSHSVTFITSFFHLSLDKNNDDDDDDDDDDNNNNNNTPQTHYTILCLLDRASS